MDKEIPGILEQSDLDEVNIRIEYLVKGSTAEIQWTSSQKRYGISIDSIGNSERILLDRDTLFMEVNRDLTVVIIYENIQSRNTLDSVDLDQLINNSRSALEGNMNKHTPFSSTFQHTENSQVEKLEYSSRNLDQIEITASIGLGLIRHDISPRIDGSISFDFMNKRAQLHNKLKLNASFFYSFRPKLEGGTSMYTNGFIGLEYAHNFSATEEALYGLGVHYLAWQNGPIFGEGDTWKVNFVYYNPKYRLQIQPELYFTNDFKEVFPGMSVLFGF